MKSQIIGTGLSGLVGTRIVELLKDTYDFIDLSYDTGVDITNSQQVDMKFSRAPGKIVLHMAAKADVDACEHDRRLGKNGAAWKINVEGTKNINDAAKKYNKKVIYISTDFVFAGNKDEYNETDKPNPINWYGKTKYEGEKLILGNSQNLVIRIAYPYRSHNTAKEDFLHVLYKLLNKGQSVSIVEDHIFTPTFIDDIAYAIQALIEKNANGIYHVVGSTSLTPFDSAIKVADIFGYRKELVKPILLSEYYQNKAPRPKKLKISNQKLVNLGVNMLSFDSGLEEVKLQGLT